MKINAYSAVFLAILVYLLGSSWHYTLTWPESRTNTPPDWYFPLVIIAFVTVPFVLGWLSRDRQR